MNQLENLEIKTINHLGIIAGIIDEIGIVEIVDEQLGTDTKEIVSPGKIVKAIILNGLGFVSRPLRKLTERPTLRWIFQCFQGIHLVEIQGIKRIYNLNDSRQFTLKFFSESIQKYYILSG